MDTGNYMQNQMDNQIENGIRQQEELCKKVSDILIQNISDFKETPIYELLVMRKLCAERISVRLFHQYGFSELKEALKSLETHENEIKKYFNL